VSANAALTGIQAVLLDVEGTTTPLAFVSDRLFPFARTHLRRHLEQHASSDDYSALFDRLHDEHDRDAGAGEPVPEWVAAPLASRLESVASYCDWLMQRDRKSTGLKDLQGRIWEEGYARGELVGEVFDDVPQALARWRERGLPIGIFSSGSALAQQLLFRHSSSGDLSRFLDWYFDTTIGQKKESESYRRIALRMGKPSPAILFVSDVTAELAAARGAGMQTVLSIRAGNQPQPDADAYRAIRTFDELPVEMAHRG
jgi:enolase-phosphatase E1